MAKKEKGSTGIVASDASRDGGVAGYTGRGGAPPARESCNFLQRPSDRGPAAFKARLDKELRGRPKVVLGAQEDFTKASKQNADWQPAWLRAIALAWSDKKYFDELVGVDAKGQPKARAFFLKYCNFCLPDHLLLTVEYDEAAVWDPIGGDDKPDTWLWRVKQTQLTMYLPRPPEKLEERPVALAAYEAMGRVYPFTTCC
jgi:ribosomally synthesized peptide (two-chain TOMM family)